MSGTLEKIYTGVVLAPDNSSRNMFSRLELEILKGIEYDHKSLTDRLIMNLVVSHLEVLKLIEQMKDEITDKE